MLCNNICSQFGLVFIDPENMYSSVRAIDRQLVLRLVEVIFSLEREQLKVDSGDLSHRNISDFLQKSRILAIVKKYSLKKCSQWLE